LRTRDGVETGEEGYADAEDCSTEPEVPKENDFWSWGLDCEVYIKTDNYEPT
jgi:hypothetical protein